MVVNDDEVYVLMAQSMDLFVIDAASGSIVRNVSIPGCNAETMALDASSQWLYVGDRCGTIHVFRTDGWVPMAPRPMMGTVRALAPHPVDPELWVGLTSSVNALTAPDLAGDLATYPIAAPGDIAFDPMRGRAYVTSTTTNTLAVVDRASRQVVNNIPVGPLPTRVIVR